MFVVIGDIWLLCYGLFVYVYVCVCGVGINMFFRFMIDVNGIMIFVCVKCSFVVCVRLLCVIVLILLKKLFCSIFVIWYVIGFVFWMLGFFW